MAFPIRFILCAALCIGLLSVLAPASAGRPFIAERVPADVDFLLVIDDAASLRKTPAGDSISSILDVVFFEGRARKRWSDLAIQLGWSEAEAFDRLLGSRIAIVGRGIVPQWGDAQLRDAADQRTAAWAVILEVSADTEQRVRERLKVAPRGIQKGRTIYAVEGGRFELAADRRKHGPSTLLLAPRNASALFDELLPRLGDAALDSFAASKPHRRIVNLPGEDLYLFARLHDDMHAWVGLRADFSRGDRLTASVVSETSHDIDPVEPWPLERFQRLADPTLACFVERRAEMKPGEIPFGAPILAQIPWMNPNENLRPLLGDLQTLMITPAERGGVSVVAALQSTDINRLPAPGDDMMHSLVNRISTLLGGGAWDLNFNGLWPQAQRTVNLDIPDGAGLRYIAHGGARIQWRYAPDECPDSSAGWLVIATDQPQLDRAAQTLTADLADHEAARWISVGLIRPAALLKSLRAGGDPVEPGLDILSTVESCAWRMKCNGDRALTGEVEVRFPAK